MGDDERKEFGFVADILRGALGFTQVGMERSTGGCKVAADAPWPRDELARDPVW